MSTQPGPPLDWKTGLKVVANSAPAILSGVAYLADVVTPEVATWTALGGTAVTVLGTAMVNCPYVTGKFISGTISPTNGETVTGIQINYSGTSSGSITTATGGAYASPWLSHGGTFKLKPDVPFHDVTPAEITVSNLTGNRPGVNFKIKRRTVTVTGRIQPASNESVGGINVAYSGATSGTVQTKGNGAFTIPDLLEGGDYTITPAVPNFHELDRDKEDIDSLLPSQGAVNFILTRKKVTLTGRITAGGQEDVKRRRIAYSGATNGSVDTKDDGTYEILNLLEGGAYQITPDAITYHTFAPADRNIPSLASGATADFQLNRNKVAVQGQIAKASNEKVGQITVSYSGDTNGSTATIDDGTFTIPGLWEGGRYKITPELPKFHTLDKPEVDFQTLAAGRRADFVLTRQKFSISGRVVSKTLEVKDVNIAWDGETTGSTVTTEKGEFVISNLPAGGAYRILPEKLHFEFDPPERIVQELRGNIPDCDFGIQVANYWISGIFNEYVPGKTTEEFHGPLAGVDVFLTGDVTDKMRTAGDGSFRFQVPALGRYKLEFAKKNYEFEPASPLQFAQLTSTWDKEIEASDTTWRKKGGQRPPRAPRWYDRLPKDTDGWPNWAAANSIASGYGTHSADHLQDLVNAVGQGPFTRTDVLPRIVAYAIQQNNVIRTNPGISRHYEIRRLPHQNGTTIQLASPIVVVWNFVANPLFASCGTVYAR